MITMDNHGNSERIKSRMITGGADGNAQKQNVSVFGGIQKVQIDQIKEDGIRKELYENERKARENWARKWEFLKNSEQLCKNEAVKRGLYIDAFVQNGGEKHSQSCSEDKRPSKVGTLVPSAVVPRKFSEMIGWRAHSKENNLEALVGPMYTSRRLTMNPPLSPEEPDLRYQKIIFLG